MKKKFETNLRVSLWKMVKNLTEISYFPKHLQAWTKHIAKSRKPSRIGEEQKTLISDFS